MKSFVKMAAAGCAVASVFVTATPAQALIYTDPISASRARCEQVSGREKDRCEFINNRIERLRYRQTQNSYERGNTMRERRMTLRQQNYKTNSTRRIRGFDMNRLRQHDGTRGNARRLINNRDEAARAACKDVDPKERSQCIRTTWGAMRRGNTR